MKINETSLALHDISAAVDGALESLAGIDSSMKSARRECLSISKILSARYEAKSPSGKQRAWARRELRRLGVTL